MFDIAMTYLSQMFNYIIPMVSLYLVFDIIGDLLFKRWCYE